MKNNNNNNNNRDGIGNEYIKNWLVYFNVIVIIMATITGVVIYLSIHDQNKQVEQNRDEREHEHDTMTERLNKLEFALNASSKINIFKAIEENYTEKNRSSILAHNDMIINQSLKS